MKKSNGEFIRGLRAWLDRERPDWRQTMFPEVNPDGRPVGSIEMWVQCEDGSTVGGVLYAASDACLPRADGGDDVARRRRVDDTVRAGQCPNGCGPLLMADPDEGECAACGFRHITYRRRA